MSIVISFTYMLVLNGERIGYFKGRKELRQGDPLFPLLFVLCLEYLYILFPNSPQSFREGKEIALNHLAFADELLFSMVVIMTQFHGSRVLFRILNQVW